MGKQTLIIFTVLALVACKDDCTPNETQLCYCEGGGTGTQTCNSSGTAWSECSCGTTDTSTDTVVDTSHDSAVDTTPSDSPDEVECTVDADCDDDDPCTMDVCDTDFGTCSNNPMDADDDGFVAAVVGTAECGGDDCDDAHANAFPGHAEDDCDDDIDGDCKGVNLRFADSSTVLSTTYGDYPWHLLWTGSEFLVLMTHMETPMTLTRVDSSGAVVGSSVDLGIGHAAWTWTGSELAAAYYTGEQVALRRYDSTGVSLGSGSTLMSYSGTIQPTHIAWASSQYGVLVSSDPGTENAFWLLRASETGASLGETTWTLPSSSMESMSMMHWTGSEFAVLYQRPDSTTDRSIELRRLDPSGTLIGSIVTIAGNPDDEIHLTTSTWTGSELALSWLEMPGETFFARLDGTGTRVVGDFSLGTSGIQPRNIHWTGSEYVLFWETSGAMDWSFSRLDPVDPSFRPDEIPFPTGMSLMQAPRFIHDGTSFAAGYNDEIATTTYLHFIEDCF